jgi:RNA polymerase sigma-70 factor (ECF subfamily)
MTGSRLSAQPSDTSPAHGAAFDSRWLAAVLRQYEGPLVLYAARITRDLERARDVVQEAFLRLLKEDPADIEPHLAEWLYTVCRNKALDVRRKESRMIALTDTAANLEPADSAAPGERLEVSESAAKALRYVGRLPDNQQEVIRLKFQHGLSYKQISAITNLSVSNVGFLIHVALKTLRQRMGVA